ncbi:MAG: glycosyltransferase family 4 protein [Gemmataceae bacterium]
MEPEFGLCFRDRLWDELTATGVPVHDLGPVRFSRPWTVWQARWRLTRLVRQRAFDAIVTHAAWSHAAFASVVRRSNIRLVHWVHDPMTGQGNHFEEWAARIPPNLAVANSRFTSATVSRIFPGVRTEVVYLPVAPVALDGQDDSRLAVRQELLTSTNDTVILQACRLERWKGHAVLIDALGRLRNLPGWTAWIAGGPQKAGEAEYLAELCRRAGEVGVVDRVRFLGQRSDVHRLMAAVDVLCQPNTGPEPFGIAFVEALYAGKPVVTAAIGGGCEVVDPGCGILVPPNDPTAVAAALGELIADPDRRSALGGAGPERAKSLCDPARQLGRVANLLGAAA